jgi:hypothetical protein
VKSNGSEKLLIYDKPERGHPTRKATLENTIDLDTVPEYLSGGKHYLVLARTLAKTTWGEFKMVKDLLPAKRQVLTKAKKEKDQADKLKRVELCRKKKTKTDTDIDKIGEQAESTTEIPLTSSNCSTPALDDDAFGKFVDTCTDRKFTPIKKDDGGTTVFDESATLRAWEAFREPCSDYVTSTVAQILAKRFGTDSPPPSKLLHRMREFGKQVAMQNSEYVFNFSGWKAWLEQHKQRPRQQQDDAVETKGPKKLVDWQVMTERYETILANFQASLKYAKGLSREA